MSVIDQLRDEDVSKLREALEGAAVAFRELRRGVGVLESQTPQAGSLAILEGKVAGALALIASPSPIAGRIGRNEDNPHAAHPQEASE